LTTLSRKILQMMATMLSAMGLAQATPPLRAERPPLGKLIGQLREDAALRARFSLNPRSVLEERGIDPAPYDLPDRLGGDDVDRFLSNWTGARGPAAGSRAADAVTLVSEDLLDLPKFLKRSALELPTAAPGDPQASGDVERIAPSAAPQRSDRRASGDEEKMPQQVPEPAPVTPVYGPPPGLRNRLHEPVSPPSPAPQPSEPQAPSDTHRPPHRSSSFGPAHTLIYGPPPGFRTKP
jgi:hypothetical protein